jgi:hypothetical protein
MPDALKGTIFNELIQRIDACKEDYVKAKGGARTAGARVRSHMITIKKLSEAIYKEMNSIKKPDIKS